ncbi:MAG: aminoacyl-tRNA hydrolase [Cytophagia bacterium]|nr:aminoacyl-tRNA hydrolase [Cytophagia bacterium]
MFNPEEISSRDFSSEFQFQTSRSSGPGGQNVNKLETRVTLRFNPSNSQLLSPEELDRLLQKWNNKLTNEGELLISSEKHRSQLRNKEETIALFLLELKKAFTDPKPRKKAKIPKAVIKKRLDNKKKLSEKKSMRKPPKF